MVRMDRSPSESGNVLMDFFPYRECLSLLRQSVAGFKISNGEGKKAS